MRIKIDFLDDKSFNISSSFKNLILVLELQYRKIEIKYSSMNELEKIEETMESTKDFIYNVLELSDKDEAILLDVEYDELLELSELIEDKVLNGNKRQLINYGYNISREELINENDRDSMDGQLFLFRRKINTIRATVFKLMEEFKWTLEDTMNTDYIEMSELILGKESSETKMLSELF